MPGLRIATGLVVLLLLTATGLADSLHDENAGVSAICTSLQAASVRIISGTDTSSGVIVSADGHVLTVAHGLHRETGSVAIVFSDGKTSDANILLKDVASDVAVLRISRGSDGRDFFPIPVSATPDFTKGQYVLAAGYPGREKNGSSPVIRSGELLVVEATVLRSSCTLTVGDSGGPLVNHKGRLIGLHRQIGLASESNLHLPIAHISNAVQSVLDLNHLAANASKDAAGMSSNLPSANDAVVAACWQRTVEIQQGTKGAIPSVLGTLLDNLHVATKLSELKPRSDIFCRFGDHSRCKAGVIKFDVALDLAILRLETAQQAVAPLSRQDDATDSDLSCRVVFASLGLRSVSQTGIVTRWTHSEPGTRGKLGAVLEVNNATKAVRINDIGLNSTAAAAELLTGDVITKVDGQPTSSLDDVAVSLKARQPGDWLQFEFQREGTTHVSLARFQHDPGQRFERTEFLDGRSGRLSMRRTGFQNVLQHDIPLAPETCGGPLCDSSGQIVGVTIARRARESTLAVPIAAIWRLADSKSP